ncbi:MAG: hypothetical protein ABFD84_13065 [Candidatus Polarisedimenticolia bacterium]
MSFDAYNRYAVTPDAQRSLYPQGHTDPNAERGGSERPPISLVPAPYVPAARFDVHKRANVTFSASLPVALDAAGNMIPAGIPGGHVFNYSAIDYQNGVAKTRRADTGVAVSAAGAVTMNSGLLAPGVFAPVVGCVSYSAFAYEGGVLGTWPDYVCDYDNPVNFPVHNTQAQPETKVAITCDYTFHVPYLAGKNLWSNTVRMFPEMDPVSAEAKSYPFAHDELVATPASTALNVDVVYVNPAIGTGVDGATGTLLFNGNYNALTLALSGSATATAGAAVNVTAKGVYMLYTADPNVYAVVRSTGVTAGAVSNVAYTLGLATPLKPYDFVAVRNGRFVKYDSTRMNPQDMVAQVLGISNDVAKDYLGRVRTAYERATNPADHLPGSATRGVPYLHQLVTDGARFCYETRRTSTGAAQGSAGASLATAPVIETLIFNLLR